MSKKNHIPGPVPPANRPTGGPVSIPDDQVADPNSPETGTGFDEQDPKRRLGDFTGAGEHSIQQPGGKQGPNN